MVLLVIASAGVRDLVSCMSTEAYWKAKGVEVSVAQLGRNLQPTKAVDISRLVADLDADDPREREAATTKIAAIGAAALPALEKAMKNGSPEVVTRARVLSARIGAASKATAVRRLMAIRTLGELKDPKGLDLLQPLVESSEMFEADYARAAIAKIQGKSYVQPAASQAMRQAEIGLLPAQIDSVMQVAPGLEGDFSIEKTINRLPLDENQKIHVKDEANEKLLELLETVGNVRIDALTWGFNAAPPTKPGNTILIARGQFDATAVCDFLGKLVARSRTLDGSNVYEINDDTALLVSGDRRIVFLSREPTGDLAMETMATALKKGAGSFADNAALSKLVKSIDIKSPLWAAGRLSPGLAEIVGPLGDFDSATLTATQRLNDKKSLVTELTLSAIGSDAAKTKKTAEETRQLLTSVVETGRKQEQALPFLKPAVDFMQSVKVEVDGTKATATGSMDDQPLLPLVIPVQGSAVQWLLR